MVTLPGVMLMSIESSRISPSLVTSSGIADDGRLDAGAAQHVGGHAEVRDHQFPREEGRQAQRVHRARRPASTA